MKRSYSQGFDLTVKSIDDAEIAVSMSFEPTVDIFMIFRM